jgi:GDPmannose 4,6-dehydratase
MKRALVTGAGGQDGWYLCDLLLAKGYEVIGCGRPGSLAGPRGEPLRARGVRLVEIDLLDRADTLRGVAEVAPDELYNLAGHSFVPESWNDPASAIRITSWPVIHLLDAIREVAPAARFYQSSTSEIFGRAATSPQDESTPVAPANPYAAAKVFAHQLVGLYRSHYGLYCCAGILYNHESPRRPPQFLTQKVARAAVAIAAGREQELLLGDLEVTRDWGYAGDSVDAMWRMLQQPAPEDVVIGTGVPHAVRDVCRVAFEAVGLDWTRHVRTDPRFMRFDQPTRLLADPRRAREKLGWAPTVGFEQLIRMLVEAARQAAP